MIHFLASMTHSIDMEINREKNREKRFKNLEAKESNFYIWNTEKVKRFFYRK